jgi:hypothetical protein
LIICHADEVNAIVLDIGACQCKAGYAGEDTPKVVIGTVRPELPNFSGSMQTVANVGNSRHIELIYLSVFSLSMGQLALAKLDGHACE